GVASAPAPYPGVAGPAAAGVAPSVAGFRPISEHDPMWSQAAIKVDSVEKGTQGKRGRQRCLVVAQSRRARRGRSRARHCPPAGFPAHGRTRAGTQVAAPPKAVAYSRLTT